MSILDKTRKVLWGRSGNRCAFCKRELVVDATQTDSESVVGDECHIISSRPNGPRYDASYHREKLDTYENLILLCRVHHKMVDDQVATFNVDIVRQIKVNHQVWVSERLEGKPNPRPLRIRRVKQNVPAYLCRRTTGKQVLDLVTNTQAFLFDHDELETQEEVDLVGGFLQTVRDWGEILDDLEIIERAKTAFDLTAAIEELESAGFFVFGGREVQFLEGGTTTERSNWIVAILLVLRKDNDAITYAKTEDDEKAPSE